VRDSLNQRIKSKPLENAIAAAVLLFLFNLVFPQHDSFIPYLVNEFLVLFTIYFSYNYLKGLLSGKTDVPISIILNTGILSALMFFIISISNNLFGNSFHKNYDLSFFNSLFSLLVVFIFLGSAVYIFTTFRELFFQRQKKDPQTYFNTMLFFFGLAFFSNALMEIDKSLDYPKDAFFVVSIILIVFNSIRVAWIAFLPKKQKYYLLIISIILSVLFSLNYAQITGSNYSKQMFFMFSPGLHTLLSLLMIYGIIYFIVIFFTTLFHLPTAEAFDSKADELSSFMDVTKLITQVFDFRELADTITSITVRVCNSDAAWLVTNENNIVELRSVQNIGYVDAELLTKKIINSDYDNIDGIKIYHSLETNVEVSPSYKVIAIAPLKVHEFISGYLFAARLSDKEFDIDEKKSIQTFGNYSALALENAKLLKESIEKERLEKELDVARDIQRKILPREIPQDNNLEISALFVPAFEVGGDYYDFFKIDDNRLGFVVADVSGKGISAAFIMAEVKGIFESLSKIIYEPKELLVHANNVLKESLDRRNFVTAVYGILDKKRGTVKIARAGHTPVIVSREKGIEKLQPSGMGLGFELANNFAETLQEMEIQLDNDDILVCYSDGITEAMNFEKEEFGYDNFTSIIKNNHTKSLDDISNKIMTELSLFSRELSQHDDITLVLIRWNKNKNGES
jgi:serine phosphatase RsbU (regulator of sigma subunit)